MCFFQMNPSQEFMNSYTFTAEKHHFGSTIECHAKNYINVEPATSDANLMVKCKCLISKGELINFIVNTHVKFISFKGQPYGLDFLF